MKKILIVLAAMFGYMANAQQDIMISQYMFNGLFLNPAYAGSHKYYTSSLLHRNQWVSFSGAPKTLLFAIDGLLPTKSENMGIGLLVTNDRIGASEQTDIMANYAYQIRLKKGKLAFGIKAGVTNLILKSDQLTYWDSGDQVFSDRKSTWVPKYGMGAYYFAEKWYAGLSVPTLLAYEDQQNFSLDVNSSSHSHRHYYLYGGYVFKLSEKFDLKPSTLIKYLPAAQPEVDLNVNLMYNKQIWLGVGYRSMDAVIFMVEYQTNTRFRVGYAYDMTTTKLKNYSAGTHEIMIGYDFGKNLVKIKTPRYF